MQDTEIAGTLFVY